MYFILLYIRDQATSCYSTPSNFQLNARISYRETLPESKQQPPLSVQYQVPYNSVRHSNKMRLEEKNVTRDIIQHHASKHEKSLCHETEFKREDTKKHDRIKSQNCQSITLEEQTLKEEDEERYLQLGETENEEFNNDNCKQRHPEKFVMKSVSTQSLSHNDDGLRTDNEFVCNIDEIKEIREENIHKKTASRIRRKSFQVFNLGNKKLTDRKQSTSLSSINSCNETKEYQNLENLTAKKDCEKKRKNSKHLRKDSVDNTKRKTSLSGAIRAVVSGGKKSERKNSDAKLPVDYSDKKLSKLESLQDKIKFGRRSSRSGTLNESPKFFHRPRTESVSSVGSNVRSLSNSFKRHSSTLSLASSFDARSMISFNSLYEEDAVKETQCRY